MNDLFYDYVWNVLESVVCPFDNLKISTTTVVPSVILLKRQLLKLLERRQYFANLILVYEYLSVIDFVRSEEDGIGTVGLAYISYTVPMTSITKCIAKGPLCV